MKLKQVVLAAAAAMAVAAAHAGPASSFDASTMTFSFMNSGIGSNVGFMDTFSLLASDLAPGAYTISGDISGTKLSFSSVTVNGTPYTLYGPGPRVGTIDFAGLVPLTVTVSGTSSTFAPSVAANYQGSLVLTPVPEPETYALMLAGLGVMGFVARRRRS